jgi:putative transposase
MSTPQMPDQVSVKDIAVAMGKTVRWVLMMADRDNWPVAETINKRRERRYRLDDLPPGVRKDVLLHQVLAAHASPQSEALIVRPPAVIAKAPAPDRPLPAPSTLSEWQRRVMDARIVILNYVDDLAKKIKITPVVEKAAKMARAGTLPKHIQAAVPAANACAKGKSMLSTRTLDRWRRLRLQGVTALAPIDQTRPLPDWGGLFLDCYRQPQKPSVADAIEKLKSILPPEMTCPSKSQADRFLAKMSAVDREKGRRTGNELRAIKAFRRRSTDELDPLDAVTCDGHTFKAKVAHPNHGRPFQPEVCACLDVATRKAIGWSAGLSESAETVSDSLGHAIRQAGIPAIFYTDPGAGNTAHVNAHPSFGRYARLCITFKTGIPGNAQARGLIERFQKSCWGRAEKLLPTYTGSDMDGTVLYKMTRQLESDIRKTGRSDWLMPWKLFLEFLAAAIETYNNRPHTALPKIADATGCKRHITPNECWDLWILNGWQPEKISDEELADMWRPRVQGRTIRGEVRLFGNIYYHSDLQHYSGQDVFKEYEPQDPTFVYVRDLDDRLICRAKWNGNKSSYFPVSAREAAREKRAQGRLARVEAKREEIELERRGSMIIDVQPDPAIIESRRQLQEQFRKESAESNEPQYDFSTHKGRHEAWKDLDRIKTETGKVPPEHAQFYEAIQHDPYWKAFRDVERDLGGGHE